MRIAARWMLKALAAAVPVTIAACSGALMETRNGRVVDQASGTGIKGIEVECSYGDGGGPVSTSADDGSFTLSYDVPCDNLVVSDVDGAENGGLYQSRTIPFPAGTGDITIELPK